MKVLWFSTNSAAYNYGTPGHRGYNGGGWTASLQSELVKRPDIELGVCFVAGGPYREDAQKGVRYFIVPSHRKSRKDKILDILRWKDVRRDEVNWPHYISHFRRVVQQFKPDVIEIFGSELYVGLGALVAEVLRIPALLHIQGLLSLYQPIYLSPGVSRWSYCWQSFKPRQAYSRWQTLNYWNRSVYREQVILKSVSHVMGRTEWDKRALAILNPAATYHYGGEVLRKEFYEPAPREIPGRLVIASTISSAPYKGFDVVLRVADILANQLHLDFEWRVFGNVDPSLAEKTTGLRRTGLGIKLCGVVSAATLKAELLKATLYFHPSWIENSPNSVAEAQILGLPVVATNVGGIPSMVKDGETGLIFPPSDPYMGALAIEWLHKNSESAIIMGKNAAAIASQRHNGNSIADNLIKLYNQVAESCQL